MFAGRLNLVHLALSLGLVVTLTALESSQGFSWLGGGSVQIIDEKENVDVESLAQALCSGNNELSKQISRLTSIGQLVDYFDRQVAANSEHKLYRCKQQHEEALDALWEMLAITPENVCSELKLTAIEDFHNQFISTQLEHVNSRQGANKDAAPQLLRQFFMHYVMEVDALCKRNLINNLEWDLKEKFGDQVNEKLFELDQTSESSDRSAFSAIFNGAMTKFTDLYSVDKYEDVLMIWDLIENSYLSQKLDAVNNDDDGKVEDDRDPETGEPIRLIVKIKTTKYLNKIKEHCYYNFKPIYRKLILPIIRLADLGYTNSGEQFKVELEELRANENVKRWYSVTQMCEAMLPVRFFEDANMEPDQVIVIGHEEAEELKRAEPAARGPTQLVQLEYEPQTNSMVGMERLESVATMDGQKLVQSVRSNLSARDRRIGRAVVKLVKNLKEKFLTTRVGRFFFSHKEGDKLASPKSSEKVAHYVEEEVSSQITKSFDEMDDEELLKLEGAVSKTRLFKSKEEAKGVGKRRRYRRKGDVDIVLQQRSEALSYTRTKSWSEIFSGWNDVLSALTPSRTKLIVVGSILVGLMFMLCVLVMMGAYWTALG